jgi:hypothetical protein
MFTPMEEHWTLYRDKVIKTGTVSFIYAELLKRRKKKRCFKIIFKLTFGWK